MHQIQIQYRLLIIISSSYFLVPLQTQNPHYISQPHRNPFIMLPNSPHTGHTWIFKKKKKKKKKNHITLPNPYHSNRSPIPIPAQNHPTSSPYQKLRKVL